VLASVHGFVAAAPMAMPGFSPRPDFGCRSGALRLGRLEIHCPKLHRRLTYFQQKLPANLRIY